MIDLGFIGCGRATAELHLPALRAVPEIRVAALCDVDGARTATVAARFGVPGRFTDAAAMLATLPLDAVAVCTPPGQHADAAIAVLSAGKHLFVEKPLGLELTDCDRVIASASQTVARAVVGFNLRQHRLLRRARAILATGRLGRILEVRSTFTTDIRHTRQLPPWRDSPSLGGDVVFELATHHFDLWHWLLGVETEEVFAWSAGAETGAPHTVVAARLSGGVLATGQFCERTYPSNEIEILGEAGRLRVSLYDFDGLEVLPLNYRPGSPATRLRSLANTLADFPAGVARARRGGDYMATYAEEWRRFVDTVVHGAPPPASLEDGRAAVAASVAAVQSAAAGKPVRV